MMTLSLLNRAMPVETAAPQTPPFSVGYGGQVKEDTSPEPDWAFSPAAAVVRGISQIPSNHPVMILRNAAGSVFEALDRLIESGSRPPGALGFMAPEVQPVYLEEVLNAVSVGIKLTKPILTAVALDSQAAQLQEIAKEFHQVLLGMRLHFQQPDFLGGISELALPDVIGHAIGYHRAMANAVNVFTGFSIGLLQGPPDETEQPSAAA